MNYDEIEKLIETMGNSKLESLEIEFPEGIKISMTKSSNVKTKENVEMITEEEKKVETKIEKEENFKIIKSPMVGTFYGSASPNPESFVKVGDKITKGKVVCIVEAMKLMNEIESEFDGEIVEVCVKNGEMVEFGMPLFKLK